MNYQHFHPLPPYMNHMLSYPFNFGQFMPPAPQLAQTPQMPHGYFSGGMMGNCQQEAPQPQMFPNFPYNMPNGGFGREPEPRPELMRPVDKHTYIIVEDDNE